MIIMLVKIMVLKVVVKTCKNHYATSLSIFIVPLSSLVKTDHVVRASRAGTIRRRMPTGEVTASYLGDLDGVKSIHPP